MFQIVPQCLNIFFIFQEVGRNPPGNKRTAETEESTEWSEHNWIGAGQESDT